MPVPPRAPALSPSRANDYQQCPLLFRFRTVDRLPEPPSAAATRGTLVHAVLEHLYDAPAEERTTEAARRLVPGQWALLREQRPEVDELFADEAAQRAWLDSAGRLLETYFALEDPRRLEPTDRELLVEHRLADGPLLRGIVDRIDTAPDGALRVVDYKTGKSPRPGYGESAAFQMRFYGLVVWRTRGVLPRMLQLVYLGDGQVLRNTPTSTELDRTEERIRSLWQAIEASARAQEWRPRPSKLCGWCAHQALCPAFGGTPPPVPDGAVQLRLGVA
ncbi:MAG: RecB family exonuclease [Cellulomonadaceae bacterium]